MQVVQVTHFQNVSKRRTDRGIRNQDVQPTVLGNRFTQETLSVVALAHVTHCSVDVQFFLRQFIDGLLNILLLPTGDHHTCAIPSEPTSNGETNSTTQIDVTPLTLGIPYPSVDAVTQATFPASLAIENRESIVNLVSLSKRALGTTTNPMVEQPIKMHRTR